MNNAVSLPFGFGTYGTSKGGCVVGKVYEQPETGKKFRFCQAHTTLVGTTLVSTATQWDPVCQVGAATFGLATDDVSAGLDATHPFCLGTPTSACPVSTSTVTYYFWAQVGGWLHTVDNGEFGTWTTTKASVKTDAGDDITLGDTLIMTSADAAVDRVASGTAGISKKAVGYALVADTDATDLVTGVWAVDALA